MQVFLSPVQLLMHKVTMPNNHTHTTGGHCINLKLKDIKQSNVSFTDSIRRAKIIFPSQRNKLATPLLQKCEILKLIVWFRTFERNHLQG